MFAWGVARADVARLLIPESVKSELLLGWDAADRDTTTLRNKAGGGGGRMIEDNGIQVFVGSAAGKWTVCEVDTGEPDLDELLRR